MQLNVVNNYENLYTIWQSSVQKEKAMFASRIKYKIWCAKLVVIYPRCVHLIKATSSESLDRSETSESTEPLRCIDDTSLLLSEIID